MKKSKVLIRTIGFLLVGIVIAIVFSIVPGTYSWFRTNYAGPNTNVAAATAQDFIEDMKIYYDKNNTPYIYLKKASALDYSPVIFFSIEGELEDYILHINSVKLEDEIKIPIIPNINLSQAISLIISPQDEVTGNIRIKHLNEFIDESLPIIISREYLIERFFFDRGIRNYNIDYLSSNEKYEMFRLIKEIMIYTNKYMEWDAVIWQENNYKIQDNEFIYLPISKVEMSDEQAAIIDIIAPNLLNYSEKLYSMMETLFNDLSVNRVKNMKLEETNQKLLDEIEQLNETIEQMSIKIEKLEVEKSHLYEQIRILEENKELNNQLIELEIDNDQFHEGVKDFDLEDKIKEIEDLE